MKRLTVNDRILLHLQQYYRHTSQYESPFEITQDGTAKEIGVSRGHVAVSLTKLKDKGLVEEKVSRVKGASRQRKVYFLSPDGVNYVKKLAETIHNRTVRFRDLEENEMDVKFSNLTAYLFPLVNRTVAPLEILDHLTEDDIFDAATFVQTSRPEQAQPTGVDVTGDMDGERSEETLENEPVNNPGSDNTTPGTFSQGPNLYGGAQYIPLYTPTGDYQLGLAKNFSHPHTFQINRKHYYYYMGRPYYMPDRVKIPTHEVRKKQIIGQMASFFILGSIFTILGIIGLLVDYNECYPIFFINFMMGASFGIAGIAIGIRNVAFIGSRGRSILIGMGGFYIFLILIATEALLFDLPGLMEPSVIWPMLLIFSTVLILVSFGKPIKPEHRTELAVEVGLFSILYGFLSFLIFPEELSVNQFLYSPYWIIFGFFSMIIGTEVYKKKKKEEPDLMKHFFCAGIGAFIILLIVSQMAYGVYASGSQVFLNYLTGGMWAAAGLYMVGSRLANTPLNEKMLLSIKNSLPLMIGTLFILIGIYLFILSKLIEGLIEFAIGLLVIRYGLSGNLISKNPDNFMIKLGFPVFLVVTVTLTFFTLLLNVIS